MPVALLAVLVGSVFGFVLVGSGDGVASVPWRMTPLSSALSFGLAAVVLVCLYGVRGRPAGTVPSEDAPPSWSLVVPAACLVLLVVTPRRFDSIAREDGLVEWIGALATACGCVWALMAARRREGVLRAGLVVAAMMFFFLTGEELSWLQRLGQYGTPDVLAGNGQGEANLHNLATDRVQALYYLGTSVALVLLPFVDRWTSMVPPRYKSLVPGPAVVILATSSVAFAYARTGNVVHHVAVWTAIGVLWWWSRAPRPVWVYAALALLTGGQVLFAAIGPDLARPWAPDEYREMLLGLALAAWCRGVLVSTRSASRVAPSEVADRSGRPVVPGQTVE